MTLCRKINLQEGDLWYCDCTELMAKYIKLETVIPAECILSNSKLSLFSLRDCLFSTNSTEGSFLTYLNLVKNESYKKKRAMPTFGVPQLPHDKGHLVNNSSRSASSERANSHETRGLPTSTYAGFPVYLWVAFR